MTHRSLLTCTVMSSVFALALGTACGPTSPAGGTGGSGGSTGGSGGSTGGSGGSTGGTGGFAGNLETEAELTAMGPYPVQSYTLTPSWANNAVKDTNTNQNLPGVIVYYPGGSAAPPFKAVATSPGWQEGKDMWSAWGGFLASHGFVLMAYTPQNLNDLPSARATALGTVIQELRNENGRNGGPLSGKIDTSSFVVMGHSMGGGGALLSTQDGLPLSAAIGLCPWSGGSNIPNDHVPSLIFAATNDPLAAPATNGLMMYNSIPGGDKAYAEFAGSGLNQHFVANVPASDSSVFPNAKSVGRIGLAWLRIYVNHDARYKTYIHQDPVRDITINGQATVAGMSSFATGPGF
jgi:hypothetical protein